MTLSSVLARRPWLLPLLFLGLAGRQWALASGGDEVIVAYSSLSADSRSVAEFYALERGVPTQQVIGLKVPAPAGAITRADYTALIQDPLISEVQKRGLMEFRVKTVPATNGIPEHQKYACTASKIRYLVLCWGLPYRINEEARMVNTNVSINAPMRRTEAAVDSELALLPIAGSYDLTAAVVNPLFSVTNAAAYHPTNGVLLVTRLDGPTPAMARGLVEKALEAEAHGLGGNAYIDLRDIHTGGYKTGDDWITNAASACKRFGFPTYVDNRPDTIPPTFPMSHVGLYFGWYAWNADGPFSRPEVEFMPGAIAYHLHSYSAADIRSPTANWVGPFIAKGATVTLGCVAEPYLDLTPNPHVLIELLGILKFTVGEAGIGCQRFLSWQNVVIGDPLYRPFGRTVFELEPAQVAANDPNLEWTVLHKVNIHLHLGREPAILRQYLTEQPLTAHSAVLSEKVALLFADEGRLRQAIEWSNKAIALSKSMQQRTRIRLNLAEWETAFDQRADAYATLLEIENERPDYRELLAFRQRQLGLVRDSGKPGELERIHAEIKRLTPSPEATKKP